MAANNTHTINSPSGFTLIELIVGIVVFAIVLTIVTSVLAPQAIRSVEPIYQVKATELANALMNEIVAKRFDENSAGSAGIVRCNESTSNIDSSQVTPLPCSLSASFGGGKDVGELNRAYYDDVDDYHGYQNIHNSLVETGISEEYRQFTLNVNVDYVNGFSTEPIVVTNPSQINVPASKLITINVTTPTGLLLQFSRHRGNF